MRASDDDHTWAFEAGAEFGYGLAVKELDRHYTRDDSLDATRYLIEGAKIFELRNERDALAERVAELRAALAKYSHEIHHGFTAREALAEDNT